MPVVSWAEFERASPDQAAAGRRLLVGADGIAIGFLGTVTGAGRPHLSPVCPIFCAGELYLSASKRSPKLRDLRGSGAYCLHALLAANDEEFQLAGQAREVREEGERAAVHAAIPFPSFDRADPVFRLGIERSLWVTWERQGQPGTRAVRRRWVAGAVDAEPRHTAAMSCTVEPIGRVEGGRPEAVDDRWGGLECRIRLADGLEEDALAGIEEFSHAEVLFLFDRVDPERVVRGARHPRNEPRWPAVGIFAQRGKGRPNRIGSTICRVLRREGRVLHLAELDAVEGTPVLDIKPVMQEFLPREAVRQPAWSRELMRNYWHHGGDD